MTCLISFASLSDTKQEKINTMIAERLSVFENSSFEQQREYRVAQKISYVWNTTDSSRSKKEVAQTILEYEGGFTWAGTILADIEFREILSLI